MCVHHVGDDDDGLARADDTVSLPAGRSPPPPLALPYASLVFVRH
jgi:hypothetical protein